MIQRITLSKGQILTKDEITKVLNSARSTFQYARFSLSNNLYLNINYNRDNTVEISTNARDISIWNQIRSLNQSYTQARIIEFTFRWINVLTKR